MHLRSYLKMAIILLLSGCASSPATLQPFTSDGCSLFPDRSLAGSADWCSCCVAHDLAYWKGGTEDERLQADQKLEQCVAAATRDKALASSMLAGVRIGGSPYLNTPFRWAYGWPAERNYQKLLPRERALAAELEARYRASGANACRQ